MSAGTLHSLLPFASYVDQSVTVITYAIDAVRADGGSGIERFRVGTAGYDTE